MCVQGKRCRHLAAPSSGGPERDTDLTTFDRFGYGRPASLISSRRCVFYNYNFVISFFILSVYRKHCWEVGFLPDGGKCHPREGHRRTGFRRSHWDHVWTLWPAKEFQHGKVHLHLGLRQRVRGRFKIWPYFFFKGGMLFFYFFCWCREVIHGTEPVVRYHYTESGNYTLRLKVGVKVTKYSLPITDVYSTDVQVLGL